MKHFSCIQKKTVLVVNTLKPFRTYVCVIAAQTAIGTGIFGPQFVLRTPQDGMYTNNNYSQMSDGFIYHNYH